MHFDWSQASWFAGLRSATLMSTQGRKLGRPHRVARVVLELVTQRDHSEKAELKAAGEKAVLEAKKSNQHVN